MWPKHLISLFILLCSILIISCSGNSTTTIETNTDSKKNALLDSIRHDSIEFEEKKKFLNNKHNVIINWNESSNFYYQIQEKITNKNIVINADALIVDVEKKDTLYQVHVVEFTNEAKECHIFFSVGTSEFNILKPSIKQKLDNLNGHFIVNVKKTITGTDGSLIITGSLVDFFLKNN